MTRIGGGGNNPEFVRWLLIRLALDLAWQGLAYWPRRILRRSRR